MVAHSSGMARRATTLSRLSRQALLLGLLLLASCSGKSGQNPAQGNAGTGGGAGGTGAGGSGGSGGELAACVGPAPSALASTGRVELPVQITVNGAPAVIGEPGIGRTGREFQLSLFKFFLSEPALLAEGGAEARAQFVTADGTPEPYELHLVDADDPATQVLHLSTEPGAYTALHFGVGVPTACNWMSGTDQVFPLNPDSDMFWTWGSQFMFIRIEGNSRASASDAWAPFMYHVGFDQAFSSLTVPGAITVGASGTGPTLSLDLDLMLQTDEDGLPSAKHSVPDGWVVDNIENNQAFTLE